ncbi:MAG TPA: AAA family ATPase [Ktedonobacteraceae bacterium]|nr:AAA family ATPase [Ktedonobacteraceae bacterium]
MLSTDFSAMLQELAKPEAFQNIVLGDDFQLQPSKLEGQIVVIQTHASAVVLVGERAYKLKKPKNLGFLDYSTPMLRRRFCIQEALLNQRLAPQVYLGVAPIILLPGNNFRFGPTFSLDQVPLPGTEQSGGCVVDYAVVMVRLPEASSLEYRVHSGTADSALLASVARCIAAFHATSHTNEQIASFGEIEVIRNNWEENFIQMQPYIGRTLDASTYDRIVAYVHHFLERRASLFANRVREGRIRDCHGDFRLQQIHVLDDENRLAILDCIEFNERFRYSDVASEIAFLAMELEAADRVDLAHAFVDAYVKETGDETARELLPFYICYRACVRGKVSSFQLDESEVPASQREEARKEARSLFKLAEMYTDGPTQPTLLMVGGIMGTGKSTLALALQNELSWAYFSSDLARKRLAHIDPSLPNADAYGQGLYDPHRTTCTYETLLVEADSVLSQGRSVLLDASFLRRHYRQKAVSLACERGAICLFVECVCPREVALARLSERWQARIAGTGQEIPGASHASDGRPNLYDVQSADWEPISTEEEQHMPHLVVWTTQTPSVIVDQVVTSLHIPPISCHLTSATDRPTCDTQVVDLQNKM